MNVSLINSSECSVDDAMSAGFLAVAQVRADVGGDRGSATVTSTCRSCACLVTRRIGRLASAVPVPGEGWSINSSDELQVHPESPPSGPGFRTDDLLDFHAMLADRIQVRLHGGGQNA